MKLLMMKRVSGASLDEGSVIQVPLLPSSLPPLPHTPSLMPTIHWGGEGGGIVSQLNTK